VHLAVCRTRCDAFWGGSLCLEKGPHKTKLNAERRTAGVAWHGSARFASANPPGREAARAAKPGPAIPEAFPWLKL